MMTVAGVDVADTGPLTAVEADAIRAEIADRNTRLAEKSRIGVALLDAVERARLAGTLSSARDILRAIQDAVARGQI